MNKLLLTTALAFTLSQAAMADMHEGKTHDMKDGSKKEHHMKNDKMMYKSEIVLPKNLKTMTKSMYTASESIGQDVINSKGETIAEVTDMAITKDGKISHIVIDVDGMVLNDKLAIPYEQFGWSDDKMALTLDMTVEQLLQKQKMLDATEKKM